MAIARTANNQPLLARVGALDRTRAMTCRTNVTTLAWPDSWTDLCAWHSAGKQQSEGITKSHTGGAAHVAAHSLRSNVAGAAVCWKHTSMSTACAAAVPSARPALLTRMSICWNSCGSCSRVCATAARSIMSSVWQWMGTCRG